MKSRLARSWIVIAVQMLGTDQFEQHFRKRRLLFSLRLSRLCGLFGHPVWLRLCVKHECGSVHPLSSPLYPLWLRPRRAASLRFIWPSCLVAFPRLCVFAFKTNAVRPSSILILGPASPLSIRRRRQISNARSADVLAGFGRPIASTFSALSGCGRFKPARTPALRRKCSESNNLSNTLVSVRCSLLCTVISQIGLKLPELVPI
jgi:hypothetical protein